MEDGGQTFPIPGYMRPSDGSPEWPQEGMSLRDWFAGQALAGLVPNAAWDYSSGPCNAAAAERCYAIADAMLEARGKTN